MHTPDEPSIPYYEILGTIAHGASGIVYRARDVRLGREAAIKVARGNQERFYRTLKIHCVLTHPGIAQLYEAAQLPDGRLFATMALVQGRTLGDIVRERGSPLESRPQLIAAFARACEALAYVHSRGVIHRNLTPHKVMIGAFGEVQLIGWGHARVIGQPEPPPMYAEMVMGAPVYLAPEQIRNEHAGARTDVFYLGGLLCFILTGRPTHASDGILVDLVTRVADGDYSETFARLDASGGDPELVAMAKRCLAPNPADRFADASEVVNALPAYCRPPATPPAPDPGPIRWWYWLGIAFVLALGVVLGLLVNSRLFTRP